MSKPNEHLEPNSKNIADQSFQNFSLKNLNALDLMTFKTSQFVSWLILPMVLLTFLIVVLRYSFGISRVWLQELIVYFHVLVFSVGISYNFIQNSHVRVDVFYTKFSQTKKTLIDLFGIIFLIWPVVILIFIHSLPYVFQSYRVLESSPDAGGLPARYFLKSLILVLCLLVFLQTASLAYKKIKFLKGKN